MDVLSYFVCLVTTIDDKKREASLYLSCSVKNVPTSIEPIPQALFKPFATHDRLVKDLIVMFHCTAVAIVHCLNQVDAAAVLLCYHRTRSIQKFSLIMNMMDGDLSSHILSRVT